MDHSSITQGLRKWQSLALWRSFGKPLLVAPLVEDPQGVGWRKETLSTREAAKAGLRQPSVLMN